MSDLYLWRISQTVNNNYDTYDSAVVVAATEEQARKIHPGGEDNEPMHNPGRGQWSHNGVWAVNWEQVYAEKLAPIDHIDYRAGAIVVASFNAG